jgi:hypothetical protein
VLFYAKLPVLIFRNVLVLIFRLQVATILRSKQAIDATFAIIETFSKIRELSRSIKLLSVAQDKTQQKSLMQKSGELISDIFDDDLQTSDTETSIELNFALLKFKHTIKKKKH